jgi:hypothetical protein
MRIFAPVRDFNGLRNNVRFVDGVGETDNTQAIEWFKIHGYTVSVEDESKVANVGQNEETSDVGKNIDDSEANETEVLADNKQELPDLDAMNPFELRQWAIDNGYGGVIRNTRSKDKLLELIRG